MSSKNTVRLQLILDVVIQPNGTPLEELKEQLRGIARTAIHEGWVTDDAEAELVSHTIDVDEILSSSDDEEPADSAAHFSRCDNLRLLQHQFKAYLQHYGAEYVWLLPTISRDTGIPESELFDPDTHEGLLTDLSNRGLLIHSSCPGANSGFGHTRAMDCNAFLE